MKQSLQLRLGQQLTMTPQLQQAIRLLQLSTVELQLEVQQALESNLMLELEEGSEDGAPEREAAPEEPAREADGADSELDLDRRAELPEDLPVDSAWEDTYEPVGGTAPGPDEDMDFESRRGTSESLRDHLLWQMGLTPLSETDQIIATALIDSINEDGYLGTAVEDIHQSLVEDGLEIEPDEVIAVLRQIQNFDPAGVGARDLRESLLIQLRQGEGEAPPELRDLALQLLEHHFQLLAGRDYAQLMRRMKLDEETLQRVLTVIRALNPRPGGQVNTEEPDYVIPDVVVTRHRNGWRVELNAEAAPRVRINPYYAGVARDAGGGQDGNYLRTQLQEARWFIKSLQSRNETLLKVATCIVERQRAFLQHGEEAMKALVLADVAQEVGMHESTISRVTTKKYMRTPRGVFELKYFFSSHVSTASGGECSATAIRALIKKLVGAENPRKPLSDSQIANILSEQGINVARRTVAKYREAMAIAPSNERKRLA